MTGTRILPVLAALAIVATACATSGSVPGDAVPATLDVDASACSAAPISSTEPDVQASGLGWIFGEELPAAFGVPLLPRERIVPVLDADGIPAIDDPTCLPVDGVGFLADNAPVVMLELGGDVRAYPLEILTWHELVNDTVGGVPVTVSYCPLCNSAIVYDRRVGDRVLDFGTSGALTQSSMVMYDRQTQTLWTHFNGQAVAGELTGAQLEFFSTAIVSWADFRAQFPDGRVLSRETGFRRDYGRNPYPGYEDNPEPYRRFITDDVDPRLPPKVRVVGIDRAGASTAVLHARLFEVGAVHFELAGDRLVALNVPGTSSALEGVTVSGGDDFGASAIFVPEADGQALTLARGADGFVDEETGSTWNIFGIATAGPLEGVQLERVPHVDTFWFAWGTFYPATAIVL